MVVSTYFLAAQTRNTNRFLKGIYGPILAINNWIKLIS